MKRRITLSWLLMALICLPMFAIRDIQLRTGRDLGATFLSGTVVVNALTELYVMFKYLRPQELQQHQKQWKDYGIIK